MTAPSATRRVIRRKSSAAFRSAISASFTAFSRFARSTRKRASPFFTVAPSATSSSSIVPGTRAAIVADSFVRTVPCANAVSSKTTPFRTRQTVTSGTSAAQVTPSTPKTVKAINFVFMILLDARNSEP